MYRTTVAVIGAAGSISAELRRAAEQLGLALADSGFDLVTGSMDGVMRAAARGHKSSGGSAQALGIKPGWGRSWEDNPHGHPVITTDLGVMRNHLVVQAADLVVAVGGGSGTLSEMALAWQMQKPIAALTGCGGWSGRLAGEQLDRRRSDRVEPCADIAQVLAWADRLRPSGVFAGRCNRGIYPLEIPAIHRVRAPADEGVRQPEPVQDVHALFGMSLGFEDCVRRLEVLDSEVADFNCDWGADSAALVTFDDGWRDVLRLRATFLACSGLQPVVFVGGNHLAEPVRPLPLQRLYHHWAGRQGADLRQLRSLRRELKGLSEAGQHRRLSEQGVAPMHSPDWLLDLDDLQALRREGWIVASHGHAHEDLRRASDSSLEQGLRRQSDLLEEQGFYPWLGWPEGQWSERSVAIARAAGFVRQFGLSEEPHPPQLPDGMAMRSLWREPAGK